jgi:GTPase
MLHRIEPNGRGARRALLVGVLDTERGDADLAELARLVRTGGTEVSAATTQRRDHVDAAYYVGRGKAVEIGELVRKRGLNLVVFDNELSPRQVRNLERACGARVMDRTELILEIFARHARTAQAQMQVELASLEYQLPRLRRMWTHLSRIHGGGASAAGALRGPGEKQLESDRRQLRHRLTDLRRRLTSAELRREREVDHRSELFSISLVGYTNAGKSSLLNALTGAHSLVADQLFSTLDTLTRVWTLPGRRRVLLSDTVGFLDRLPHHLVSSFHATLAETLTADLLLHVVDASSASADRQIRAVDDVLAQIGAGTRPRLLVFNKADRANGSLDFRLLRNEFPNHVVVSAVDGTGLSELASAVESLVHASLVEVVVRGAAGDGKLFALLREHGRILDTQYDDERVVVRAAIDPREEGRIRKHLNGHGGTCDRVAEKVRECGVPGRL